MFLEEGLDRLVAMLRAAGDPTRLRLLLLLREAELTVSELVDIVGQSQPRVSRHLKLLGEADQFLDTAFVVPSRSFDARYPSINCPLELQIQIPRILVDPPD